MLFLLTGKPRSGKDTVAKYLNMAYGMYRTSLAQGIYSIAESYFGMEKKDRDLLIAIGEKMREIDKLVWCKAAYRDILSKGFLRRHAVISDIRMPHEVEFFKRQALADYGGCRIIRVCATVETRAEREGFNAADDDKPTEVALDGYPADYTIHNNSTLGNLYNLVDMICYAERIYKVRYPY